MTLNTVLALFDRLRDRRRRIVWSADQAVGRRGEDLAHRHLRSLGYTVVARNWRLPSGDGEADLIAWDRDELVIVEVKTRETSEYGLPDRAIGPEKIRSLGRIARAWAKSTGTGRVRADVVTVVLSPHISLNLHKDAVDFGKRLLPGAIPTSAIL